MAAVNIITHKVGDTFSVNGTYKDANGNLVNLTTAGITIASSVLDPKTNTRYPLVVTIVDQSTNLGQYTIIGATDAWPVGKLLWDIQYTQAAFIYSTDTIIIRTEQNVTL